MKTETPRTDAWCELAMSADVSAVLDLAKQFERELNQWKEIATRLNDAAVFVMAAMPEHIQGWQSQSEMNEAMDEYTRAVAAMPNDPKLSHSEGTRNEQI